MDGDNENNNNEDELLLKSIFLFFENIYDFRKIHAVANEQSETTRSKRPRLEDDEQGSPSPDNQGHRDVRDGLGGSLRPSSQE